MKITKSAFWGQNSGGGMGGGQANFSGSGGDPPSPPPLGGNPDRHPQSKCSTSVSATIPKPDTDDYSMTLAMLKLYQ